MSLIILERKDNYNLSSSFTQVYKTGNLYKLKTFYRKTILRIVKKSILSSNFIYYYSKKGIFVSAIFNLILINLNFLFFPKFFSISSLYINMPDFTDIKTSSKKNSTSSLETNSTLKMIFGLLIINIFDILFILIIMFNIKYKQRRISKYMQKYAQLSYENENYLIKQKYHCTISTDGRFNIIVKSNKNNDINKNSYDIYQNNKYKKNKNIFFEYVINFPNIRLQSNYYYRKMLLPQEKEILSRIISISSEIEYKYKKKLLTFLLIIAVLVVSFSLMNLFSEEKRRECKNYLGILILLLFVERNNFFQNKNEQIEKISLLNNEYIAEGYYIYINKDIISIFFLKENYRRIEAIEKIKSLNENLLDKLDLK